MWLRLRQIALIAHDIETVVADLRAVFGLEVGHVDPGVARYGLENRVIPVGSQFLEVVSPIRPGTAGGRYLQQRGGDGGYMVICQCDDHAPRRRRVEQLGIRIVEERAMPTYRLMQLHPKDTGGSFLEIDWHTGADEPVPPWTHGAGEDWRKAIRTDVIQAITAAEIQSADPAAVARRWSEIVEIPVEQDSAGHAVIPLENATLHFVPSADGRGEGLGGVDVAAVDRERLLAAARARGVLREDGTIVVCGTRFRVV